MTKNYYLIAIFYGQNTEYWNSALVNDENTTKNAENAEYFETIEEAQKELETAVKPFGFSKCWNVIYAIEKIF